MIFYPLFFLEENVANIINQQNTKDLGLNWQNYRLLALHKRVHLGHSYDILGARMLWKPKEARILKNFIDQPV